MSRMIYVPMLPTPGRYTAWWHIEFEKMFKEVYGDVIVLGKESIAKSQVIRRDLAQFSNIEAAILLEMDQIAEYMDLELRDDDILFLSDLSFPGLFTNAHFHKPFPRRSYAYCHATSKNAYDYFYKTRKLKFKNEINAAKLFRYIFVGSYYHQRKISSWNRFTNTKVVRLPHPPEYIIKNRINVKSRGNDIISVGRPGIQKNNMKLEKHIEKALNTKIVRGVFEDPIEYSNFLSDSKILFISTKEDTFNYTIMDAIKCGCIPIAPNKLCFPEILDKPYLYNDAEHAIRIIQRVLSNQLPVPRMFCETQVEAFYRRIMEIM